MNETFFCADTHLDHDAIRVHCKRPYNTLDAMNEAIVLAWNSVVDNKDTVYIGGDFAFRNHRKWVNELKGKKILIVGNHDHMPQDVLDLFKPDWKCDDVTAQDAIKTMVQFREVHQQLDRVICGQRMTLNHYPMRSWSSSVHGAWCLHGHVHGRMRVSLPGEIGGGMILDVGWDVWHKPIPFGIVKAEMEKKLAMMPQNFRDHVLKGKPLGRIENNETGDVNVEN